MRLARTSSDQSATILGTDTVTLTIPANCITTASGPVAAQTITLANLAGGSLFGAFPATAQTMGVGYNLEGEQGPCSLYTNLAHRLGSPGLGSGLGDQVVTSNADGYPLTINGPFFRGAAIFEVTSDPGGLGKGLAGPPPGLYTVIWDTDGSNTATDLTGASYQGGSCNEATTYRNITGTTNNVRVFNVQPSSVAVGMDFQLTIAASGPVSGGSYPVSLRNLRIYPPNPSDSTGMTPWGVATGGTLTTPPLTYHPNFFAQIGPVQCLRWLDPLNTNANCVQNYSQYRQATHLSRGGPSAVTVSNIVSVGPVPAGVDPYFCLKSNIVAYVTTDAPHGAFDGLASLQFSAGGTLTASDGSTLTLNGFSPNAIHVLDATHFLFQYKPPLFNNPPYGRTLMTGCGAGGQVLAYTGTAMPPSEIVAICNGAPGQGGDGLARDLWWNISLASTDACDRSVAAYVAANLKGKVYLEFGNETWNFAFAAYYFCSVLSSRQQLAAGGTAWSLTNTGGVTDSDYSTSYVAGAVNKHNIWRAAFVAAGRPATGVIRVIGTCGGNTGNTTSLCGDMTAHGGTIRDPRLIGLCSQLLAASGKSGIRDVSRR